MNFLSSNNQGPVIFAGSPNNKIIFSDFKFVTRSSYGLNWFHGTSDNYGGIQDKLTDGDWGGYGISRIDLFFNNMKINGQTTPRKVTFLIDMSVQIELGTFDPATGTGVVEVRGDFNGFSGGNVLTDEDGDGIYSGTFTIAGAQGSSVAYKFWATGLDFESGPNRTFTLGPSNVDEVLTVVFFNDDPVLSTLAVFSAQNITDYSFRNDGYGVGFVSYIDVLNNFLRILKLRTRFYPALGNGIIGIINTAENFEIHFSEYADGLNAQTDYSLKCEYGNVYDSYSGPGNNYNSEWL